MLSKSIDGDAKRDEYPEIWKSGHEDLPYFNGLG